MDENLIDVELKNFIFSIYPNDKIRKLLFKCINKTLKFWVGKSQIFNY